jgi:hypothetical protein
MNSSRSERRHTSLSDANGRQCPVVAVARTHKRHGRPPHAAIRATPIKEIAAMMPQAHPSPAGITALPRPELAGVAAVDSSRPHNRFRSALVTSEGSPPLREELRKLREAEAGRLLRTRRSRARRQADARMCVGMVAAVDDGDTGEHGLRTRLEHALASLIGSRTTLPHSRIRGSTRDRYNDARDFRTRTNAATPVKRRDHGSPPLSLLFVQHRERRQRNGDEGRVGRCRGGRALRHGCDTRAGPRGRDRRRSPNCALATTDGC